MLIVNPSASCRVGVYKPSLAVLHQTRGKIAMVYGTIFFQSVLLKVEGSLQENTALTNERLPQLHKISFLND